MSSSNIGQTSNFSPNQISGCELWLDAADSSSVLLSGSNVTQWNDKSGNARNATQATASNQPTYSSSNLNFNGTSSFLTLADFVARPTNLFAVVQANTLSAGQMHIFRKGRNPGSTFEFTLRQNNADLVALWGYGVSTSLLTITAASAGSLTRQMISALWDGTTANLYTNANVVGTSNLTASQFQGTSTYRIGASFASDSDAAAPSLLWNGSMQEILVYDRTPTVSERQIIEGYLAWKWDLRTSLPTNHPYYNTPVYSLNMPNVVFPLYSYPTPLFQPTFFSNCTLWLDAADRSSLTINHGLQVTQWRDKSGLGNHGSNVGVIRLTSQIGGLPAMTYPGTAPTYFIGSNVNNASTLTAFSVFLMNTSSYIVARILSLARIGSVDFNNTLYTAAIQRSTNNFLSFRNLTNLGTIAGTFGSPVQVATLFTGSSNTFFMNGTAGTTVSSSGNFGYSNYEVGGSFGEESLVPLNGSIGEVIIFNRALPTTQRQQIEGYLAWKWSLVTSLPADHPYKTVAFGALPPYPQLPSLVKTATNGVFRPTSIANLSGWYDPSDLSSLSLSGSSIVSMTDKSGNGRTATGSATRPVLAINILNRKPVITFNGTNQFFTMTLTVPLQSHCLIAVHRPNTLVANNSLFRFQASSGSYIVFPYYFGTNRGYITSADGTPLNFQNSVMVENSSIASYQIIIANIQSGEQRVYRNGSLQTSETQSLTSGTSATMSVGAWAAQNGEFYNGNLAEMMVFSGFLNDSQRQQIEGYLAWKWGLVASLPSTHPYKLFPPPP